MSRRVRRRASMAELAATVATPQGLMRRIWEQVSSPEVRPFVRLFFEVFAPWPTRWASRPTRSLCAWVSRFPVDS